MSKIKIILAALLLIAASNLMAKVSFPSVISDNMVLQQRTEAALWGKASPGRKVSVKAGWSNEKFITMADKETGKWFIRLKTPDAGGPYEISVSDGETTTLKNVMIGEVWFCSGQSNMEMYMKGYGSQPTEGAMDYIVGAKESRPIRMCNISRQASPDVLEESEGSWLVHSPEAVANTSATAYFFAETVQGAIDIPVGIIVSSWGGSAIEAWINKEIIKTEFPEFKPDNLDAKGKPKKERHTPSFLYNGQVAPLVPYTFKGMIWYQGETNRGREEQYIRLQTAYVKMMREVFSLPEAPFYFVQIAPYPYGKPEDFRNGYFNEAQQKTLELIPRSGMAVTCDIGEYGTIHPCRKQEVGKRLAYLALRHDYGMKAIEADAPTYNSVAFKDKKAYVKFNVDKLGLSPMGADIKGFEIAGSDQVFHPATGRLSKDLSVIEVYSPQVPEPVAVRYCFRNWSVGGLYNNFGIPAAPFRTDDWNL